MFQAWNSLTLASGVATNKVQKRRHLMIQKIFVLLSLCVGLVATTQARAANFVPRGPKEAPVTIVMFGDFECPFTQRGVQIVADLVKEMPKDLKVVFRNYPLSFHPNARTAAQAAVCAEKQNKFWEMHDGLFAVPRGGLSPEAIFAVAKQAGLDMTAYAACMTSEETDKEVERDIQEGNLLGVMGTPNYVLVGPKGLKKVNGAYPASEMKSYIKEVQ
jgi:protein-disulfide isomerase